MMVSVLLVAIGTALALPSYRDMVEKRQLTNGAEQVAAFVNSAQGAAMKTNRIIKVSWNHVVEDEWCVGATVVAALDDSACDCSGSSELAPACKINGQDFVVNQSHADDRELMQDIGSADTGSYSFDPIRGFSPDLADDLVFRMRSDSGDFRLNLMVNRTGRVILCSPSESHAVPGYQPCPIVPEEPSA
jgi:type IV fimbrial biogenesis protein FimT